MNEALIRILLVGIVLVCIVWFGKNRARAFASRQRATGRWNDRGPIVETEGPYGGIGGGMQERLEVIGKYKPKPWGSAIVESGNSRRMGDREQAEIEIRRKLSDS